jgi:hypothetical protein
LETAATQLVDRHVFVSTSPCLLVGYEAIHAQIKSQHGRRISAIADGEITIEALPSTIKCSESFTVKP